MTPTEALAILRIALELAERMAQIARRDPDSWEKVKSDYNAAMEKFRHATGQ